MRGHRIALVVLAAGLGSPAWSQEIELSAKASLVTGVLDETGAGRGVSGEPLLDAGLVATRTDTLDSGLQLVWRGELRLQRDAPGRPSFAGDPLDRPGPAPGGPGMRAFSPATGLGGRADGDDLYLAIEGASLAASGAWGEGVVGLDAGVAARLDARAPLVFESMSVLSPALDPTGRSIVRARNDVTGPSAKASYLTPRWLGLRAGGSYTPEANLRGSDHDPRPEAAGFAGADLQQVREAALSFDRRFRSNGVRIRAAATAVFAEPGQEGPGFVDYEAWGGGLEIEREGWTGGVRYLSSNNARAGGEGYEAIEGSLVRETGDWRFGIEAGWARDDLQGIEGTSFLVGARRAFGEHVMLGVGWADSDLESPAITGVSRSAARGLVLEATVRK
jgi:hypothetical protein